MAAVALAAVVHLTTREFQIYLLEEVHLRGLRSVHHASCLEELEETYYVLAHAADDEAAVAVAVAVVAVAPAGTAAVVAVAAFPPSAPAPAAAADGTAVAAAESISVWLHLYYYQTIVPVGADAAARPAVVKQHLHSSTL